MTLDIDDRFGLLSLLLRLGQLGLLLSTLRLRVGLSGFLQVGGLLRGLHWCAFCI
jgi:hypothetical protein